MKYMIIISLLIILNNLSLFTFQKNQISSNFYTKLNEFNSFSLDSSFLLKSFDSISNLKCLASCEKTSECFYTVYQNKKCYICKKNLTLFMKYNTSHDVSLLIYQKQIKHTNGLINYWTFNGNVNDCIGEANLYQGSNVALTLDRYGQSNSALSLSNGFYKVPPGVYFSGSQLTIMAWVKVRSYKSCSRLVDFGNGANQDNIVLTLDHLTNGKPYLNFFLGTNVSAGFSTKELNLNQWQHLACVLSSPYYSIYIDGIETTLPGSKISLALFNLAKVNRTSNFIGRSNWGDPNSDAIFDDLKFFNRALTQKEIQFEMNNNL